MSSPSAFNTMSSIVQSHSIQTTTNDFFPISIQGTAMQIHADAAIITPPNNPSSRCRDVFLRLNQRLGHSFGSAFAFAMGIENYDQANPDHKDLVRIGMSELRKQIIQIISDLQRLNFITPELYSAMIGARDMLGKIDQLDSAASQYPQLIDEKVTLTFGWAACVIETNSEIIDYELIAEILSELMTLKTLMSSTNLPAETRILFKRLIDSLERAAIEANFTGLGPIKRAVREAKHDAEDVSDQLKQENTNMSDGHKDFLTSASGVFEKVGKIVSGAKEVAAIVAPAVAILIS